ncbi:hypothetical protein D3C71_1320820 [compost metagenome]
MQIHRPRLDGLVHKGGADAYRHIQRALLPARGQPFAVVHHDLQMQLGARTLQPAQRGRQGGYRHVFRQADPDAAGDGAFP